MYMTKDLPYRIPWEKNRNVTVGAYPLRKKPSAAINPPVIIICLALKYLLPNVKIKNAVKIKANVIS